MTEGESESGCALASTRLDGPFGVAACPEEAWHRCFSFLLADEVARSALAFLSGKCTRESISSAWDVQVVLGGSWPKGTRGLHQFLAAARSTYLSESTLSQLFGTRVADKESEPRKGISRIVGQSRSLALSSTPSALAFSGVNQPGEGLLAIASGREVKLIGRDDMKSCGTFALALPKGCKEVGMLAFSSDSSIVAAVPLGESGSLMSEVQFYATEEKSKPLVAKMSAGKLSGIDFLHAQSESGDLVATCGDQLSQISPLTGNVVRSWKSTSDSSANTFNACVAVSRHEVAAATNELVGIWDVRTADGLARSVDTADAMTALNASSFSKNSTFVMGDVHGCLHRIDWRMLGSSPLEKLWSPPTDRVGAAPAHRILAERGCVCLLSGTSLTTLAMDPCIIELGWTDIRSRLYAVASAPGVWAFATDPAGRSGQSTLAIVDSNGHSIYHQVQRESLDASAQKSEKLKQQKEKKKEKQGKKPSCGKAAHGRNSGR